MCGVNIDLIASKCHRNTLHDKINDFSMALFIGEEKLILFPLLIQFFFSTNGDTSAGKSIFSHFNFPWKSIKTTVEPKHHIQLFHGSNYWEWPTNAVVTPTIISIIFLMPLSKPRKIDFSPIYSIFGHFCGIPMAFCRWRRKSHCLFSPFSRGKNTVSCVQEPHELI